ncbi:MAG: hypothetical protein M3P40_12045 [Actinomycetota bacterium]|nr:hypothetical protein [Actinomycetota bacterium]
MSSALTFRGLKWLSFAHSAVYLGLLIFWAIPERQPIQAFFGWSHGIGWIVISLLVIVAVRHRVLPLWLAVTVAVIGAIGPFAGSIGFVWEEHRRNRGMGLPSRYGPRQT